MRTTVLPTDPQSRKAYMMSVLSDSYKEQYFAKHTGPERSRAMVVRKSGLDAAAGDEVTTTLVAKLRGGIIREGEKMEGKEMRLDFATHKMRISTHRQGINCGTAMDATRVGTSLGAIGRERLKEYIAEYYEEVLAAHAAGSRGVGEEFQILEVGYSGYPNALRAPDQFHLFTGTDGSKTKATLTSTDKLSAKTLQALTAMAAKMLGGVKDGKPVKMQKCRRGNKDMWTLVTMDEGIQDIRNDIGTNGWFEAQKALASAIGKESEIFMGGAGYMHGTIVDSCDTLPKFNDYGASSNVKAMRSLFCGANGLAVAHGAKGSESGMALNITEDTNDRGHEAVINFTLTMGADKTTYTPVNGNATLDFAIIAVDSAYTVAPGQAM